MKTHQQSPMPHPSEVRVWTPKVTCGTCAGHGYRFGTREGGKPGTTERCVLGRCWRCKGTGKLPALQAALQAA